MNTRILALGAISLSFLGAGCATKKYISKTVAPIETRVAATETKNVDQDKQIGTHTDQIVELDRDLSRTRERLTDTDQKATAAGNSAKAADQKADGAQKAADGAAQAAAGARTLAENLGRSVNGMNRFKMTKSETVLFRINQWTLQDDAKSRLETFAQAAAGVDRYIVEIQGFTDKTGSAEGNEVLSQRRAQEVARYLVNEDKIPLRNMSMLGSGYAQPVADDKTRDGRKQNRRVEVRLLVPEVATVAQASPR
ncbi:MAG: OmpA family protein [Acidobacteriia bacterium]|nr:OmpA family protein [Terriglobia bacterium]